MDMYGLDGDRLRPSFVLVSEQEAHRTSRRVGRVTLDDTFKRFELFHYLSRTEKVGITSELGDYSLPCQYYSMFVAVSGAGPAKPYLFVLQPFEDGIRLSDGTEKGSVEVTFCADGEDATSTLLFCNDILECLVEDLQTLKEEAETKASGPASWSETDYLAWIARLKTLLACYPYYLSFAKELGDQQRPEPPDLYPSSYPRVTATFAWRTCAETVERVINTVRHIIVTQRSDSQSHRGIAGRTPL